MSMLNGEDRATTTQSAALPELLILDGGLGTTLEDTFQIDISSPLWSAKPVNDDPEAIIVAHLAFLRAGADIILTSTYQCSFEAFARCGFTRDDAQRIMRKSVALAVEARRQFLAESRRPKGDRSASIALSLGPFAATLSPAQEYDGHYPPPYGPCPSSPSDASTTNAFSDPASEASAIAALAELHHARLRVFADDAETWGALDFVAFETVPVRREIVAIRRAIARLARERADVLDGKRWWISTLYPTGKYVEDLPGGGRKVAIRDVVDAALRTGDGEARPWGFGINCTGMEFLSALLREANAAVAELEERTAGEEKPWLVVYPNGGGVYVPETKEWRSTARDGDWASALGSILRDHLEGKVWEGVVVGGCCKTGPEDIRALEENLRGRVSRGDNEVS